MRNPVARIAALPEDQAPDIVCQTFAVGGLSRYSEFALCIKNYVIVTTVSRLNESSDWFWPILFLQGFQSRN